MRGPVAGHVIETVELIVEVNVGERGCGAVLGTVRSPFVAVDGLGRALSGVVGAGHESKDIFEIRYGRNGGAAVPCIGVHVFGQLGAGGEVVAAAGGIDVIDWLGQ